MKKKEIYLYWTKNWIEIKVIDEIIINCLKIDKNKLLFLEEIDEKEIFFCFEKYKLWIPLEYIFWKALFYSREFIVDNRVLIPRNDTEVLVQESINIIKNNFINNIIDVWTWTSAIPISILLESGFDNKTYVIDISKQALEVSFENIKKFNIKNITQINSDLLTNILNEKIDLWKNILITANLPYIKNNDFENMDKSVYLNEPNLALYWWKETWFELYEKLIDQVFLLKEKYLLEKIYLIIEIWFDQYEYSKNYLEKKSIQFEYFKDLNKINRIIKIIL